MESAMVWMFVSLQNVYVEILPPKLIALGGGAFGWWLGHEGRALMNEVNAFPKETPES